MALLRQCLQELRLRQRAQASFLPDAHARSWAWATTDGVLNPPAARQAQALTPPADSAALWAFELSPLPPQHPLAHFS